MYISFATFSKINNYPKMLSSKPHQGLECVKLLPLARSRFSLNRNFHHSFKYNNTTKNVLSSLIQSVVSFYSCLLERLNCGYKHMNVNHPGPPRPFVLANTQNLTKQFGPSFLQFKTSMCGVHAS